MAAGRRPAGSMIAAMRTARPTTDLHRVAGFYEEIVGLTLLGSFIGHEGFDGVIFGVPDASAQLELVTSPHRLEPTPTPEDALVLYYDRAAAHDLVSRLRAAGTPEVGDDDPGLNPFWPRTGAVTFVDPDGYRLIVTER